MYCGRWAFGRRRGRDWFSLVYPCFEGKPPLSHTGSRLVPFTSSLHVHTVPERDAQDTHWHTILYFFTCGFIGFIHGCTDLHTGPWELLIHTAPHVNPRSSHMYTAPHVDPWSWCVDTCHSPQAPTGRSQTAPHLLALGPTDVILPCPSAVTVPLKKGTRALHLLQMAPLLLPLRSE